MFSEHAMIRCQQRGIRRQDVEMIMSFGETIISAGAEVIFLSRRAFNQAARSLTRKEHIRLQRSIGSYLVLSHEGVIVTVGKRYKRVWT